MAIAFPLFVYEPGDVTSLHTIESFDAAEDVELEELDVEHENFLYWDARGVRVQAGIRRTGSHWLQLTSTGEEDLSGLREAVRAYAAAVGVPPEEVDTLSPADAVRRLEDAVERERGPRRWYQFWR
jgi:hypothetical protein